MKRFLLKYGAAAAALLGAGSAMATAVVDYSTVVTSASSEITASATTALPLFGLILAIGVGIRIVKKFGKG
jgi:hypothetical protein